MASVVASGNGDGFSANMQPRPQIGIERLQARRASNEPKEAMNCKSCRKRKVRSAIGTAPRPDLTDALRRSSATDLSQFASPVKLSTVLVFMVGDIQRSERGRVFATLY